MNPPAISIIVPVYKAEAYLERCIDSIISQTFTNWELLLIDDGSPDCCGRICDAYERKDSRFHVFHKTNGGVASAREVGMQHAIGEYSIHVDPDDWIDPYTLEELYKAAKSSNADIVVCDFLLNYGSRTEILKQEVYSSDEFLRQLFSQERHGSLCNKLIRTELYKRYDLHFPKEIVCWEDLYICCNLLMSHPCKITYVPKAFYYYDFASNPNSMVRKASMKTLDGMISFCRYFDNRLSFDRKAWLNETKGLVLATAYRCHLLSAEKLRSIFPEINSWYIGKYLHDYPHVIYCGVAQVLNGKSLKDAYRFQKWNELYQRIRNKISRIL